jgi:Holliday junction resolvasome RuvABC endonuclease subunit
MKLSEPWEACILGLDPGLANCGFALARPRPGAGDKLEVLRIGTWSTKKETKKTGLRVADDNVRRARELAAQLRNLAPPMVICAEAMSHPRHAGNAGKLALSWGIVAAYAEQHGLPVRQASPQAIKQRLCGRKDASKLQVQRALERLYPGVFDGLNKGQREHAADALGAIEACRDADVVQLALRLT